MSLFEDKKELKSDLRNLKLLVAKRTDEALNKIT